MNNRKYETTSGSSRVSFFSSNSNASIIARALGCAAKLAAERPCSSKRRRSVPKLSSAKQNASTTCEVKFQLPCPRSLEPRDVETSPEPLDRKAIQREAARKSSNKPVVTLKFDIRQALNRRCAADPVCIRDADEELYASSREAVCAARRSIQEQPTVSKSVINVAVTTEDEKYIQIEETVDVGVDSANLAEIKQNEDKNGHKLCFALCNETICKDPCGDLYPCKNPKCWKRKKKVIECTDCGIQTFPPTKRRKKCYGMCEKSAKQKIEHDISVKTCRCTECQCYCCTDPSCQKDRPEQRRATPADANCRFKPKNKSCGGACSECSKKCRAMDSTRNLCCDCVICLCPKCKDPNIDKPGLPTPLDSTERVCKARCTKKKRKTDTEEVEKGVCPCFVMIHEEESVKKPPIIFNCHACTCGPVVKQTEPEPEEEEEVKVETPVVDQTPEEEIELEVELEVEVDVEEEVEVEVIEEEVEVEVQEPLPESDIDEPEIEEDVETEIASEIDSEPIPEVPTPPPPSRVPSEPVYACIQESKLVGTDDMPDASCVCVYPTGTRPEGDEKGDLSEKTACRGPCTVTEICLCCNCAGKQNLIELCKKMGNCYKVQIGEKPED